MSLRLAFMGTPAFSVPVLSELISAGHEVCAVYTQPPRPAGRGQKLRPSPIHDLAESYRLPVRAPLNFKNAADRDAFIDLDLDVAIVVAYGLILPKAILEAPRFGCLNLHASLLPRWRGAAPIHRAIMAGDEQTGVQVMQMEAGLDTGPVLLSETVQIMPTDTTGKLHERLSHIGALLVPRALAALERCSLTSSPQSDDGITYAHKITTEEAEIDWSRPAHEVDCHIRGLSPAPGAWFRMQNNQGKTERMKTLLSCLPREGCLSFGRENYSPGTLVQDDQRLFVICGEGVVELLELQRPGKPVQSVEHFINQPSFASGQKITP